MGEQDSGEKTEEATPHKLQEARKKGQIAKSADLTAAIMFVSSFYLLNTFAQPMWIDLERLLRTTFSYIGSPMTYYTYGTLLMGALTTFFSVMLPIAITLFIIAFFVEALQTGFLISIESLSPKLDQLNPINGLKELFSMKQFVELIKSSIKLLVVIWIVYGIVVENLPFITISQQSSLLPIAAFTGKLVMTAVTRVGIFYFMIAVFDYFYQRYEFNKSMKMSKKEIKDEYKQLEGDPMIKQRQREAARQMSAGRQMGSIPQADVVVTNPIHIAIAIQYQPHQMMAPVVLAKGKRLVAAKIRELAQEHRIPIVENPPLAQALYPLVEPDTPIPELYYKAVAEILAFVYNLKKKQNRRH
ncbi:flagellar biosynthesis protein FlhB [bacterium]|nr:flagellar biosynthesis protein FlhB [bacterium]